MKVNMRKLLLASYLIFYAVCIFFQTKDYFETGYSFWGILWLTSTLSLPAVSILLYTLSYKPKHFTWFWKIVPFTFLAYNASIWYFLGPLPFNTKQPLPATIAGGFVATGLLFVAFYLSFKFAYPQTVTNRRAHLKVVIFSLVATTLCIASRHIPSPRDKVNIKINYVTEYNKITKPVNYDPNENAAPYYEKAFAVLVDMPNDIKDIRKIWPVDMNEAKLDNVKNWLASNSQAIEYLKTATQKPYYWVERYDKNNFLLNVALPELSKFRHAAFCLSLQAKLTATQDQVGSALKQVIEIYKIGVHLRGNKILVEQLVGTAIDAVALQTGFQILSKTKPDSALLQNFQNRIETLVSEKPFTITYTSEKLIPYDCIQRMFTDDGKEGGYIYGTRFLESPAHFKSLWGQELTDADRKNFRKLKRQETVELADKTYQSLEELSTMTPFQLHEQNDKPIQAIKEKIQDNPLLRTLMPNTKLSNNSYRLKVETEALITTVAVLRYKAEKNEYPATLQELAAAGYIKEVPIDPFSGEPPVYKRTADDFILYSIGENFTDDGGAHSGWRTNEGDYVYWPVQAVEPEKQNQ